MGQSEVFLNGLVGAVFEVEVHGAAGVDGGVVDEGVPCVVAVGEPGVVGSVGVDLFDTLAFFVGLADPCPKVGVAPGVAFIVGMELVESVLVGVLVLGVGGVDGEGLGECFPDLVFAQMWCGAGGGAFVFVVAPPDVAAV